MCIKKFIQNIHNRTLEKKIKCPNELRCWHGAAVIYHNNIISFGTNHYKKHCDLSIHAEKDAIMKCDREKLRKSVLVVIRISRDGKKTMISKPCHRCAQLIESVGIPKVYYSI